MSVGSLEEIIDDNHAIVSASVGSEYYVSILSFVDKDQLEPGCTVLLNHKVSVMLSIVPVKRLLRGVCSTVEHVMYYNVAMLKVGCISKTFPGTFSLHVGNSVKLSTKPKMKETLISSILGQRSWSNVT